eukprot:s10_g54.t1
MSLLAKWLWGVCLALMSACPVALGRLPAALGVCLCLRSGFGAFAWALGTAFGGFGAFGAFGGFGGFDGWQPAGLNGNKKPLGAWCLWRVWRVCVGPLEGLRGLERLERLERLEGLEGLTAGKRQA